MATGIHLSGNHETIDLQQQVARLQALLEASRQVHSTIREEAVLGAVLRIVVRELEMAGAAFSGTDLSYGDIPEAGGEGESAQALPLYLLQDREGKRMAELLVAPPEGRDLTLYEADFIEGLVLQAAVALENARNPRAQPAVGARADGPGRGAQHSAFIASAGTAGDFGILAGVQVGHLLRGGRRRYLDLCGAA